MIEALESRRMLASVGLDPTFANAGIYTAPLADYLSFRPQASAALAHGKLLEVGTTGQTVLVRLKADGSLDPGFGAGGVVTASAVKSATCVIPPAIYVLRPDGRGLSTVGDHGVVRIGASTDHVRSVLETPTGETLVTLETVNAADPVDVVALNSALQPDKSYGVNGEASDLIPQSGIADSIGNVIEDADGNYDYLQTQGELQTILQLGEAGAPGPLNAAGSKVRSGPFLLEGRRTLVIGGFNRTSGAPPLSLYRETGRIDTGFGTQGNVDLTDNTEMNYSGVTPIGVRADGTITVLVDVFLISVVELVSPAGVPGPTAAVASEDDATGGSTGGTLTSSAIAPDGKLVAAVTDKEFGSGMQFDYTLDIERYGLNLQADASFGTAGVVAIPQSANTQSLVAPAADDSLYFATLDGSTPTLLHLTASGTMDSLRGSRCSKCGHHTRLITHAAR